MYAMIRTLGREQINPGDPVVLKYDTQFGRVGAFSIDGRAYGYLYERQPSGCVDEWIMYSRIGDRRIIAKAAVILDDGLLLGFDNPAFDCQGGYMRVEKAGYGMLVQRL